ncbi:MAG: cysteine desulfurase-like protein [Bacteroidota bacterium]
MAVSKPQRSLEECRSEFPSLTRTHNGLPLAFLDGPAGTQVPSAVIEAIGEYYRRSNANTHGAFVTTHETDEMLEAARTAAAAFLGAPGAHTISFGANMTTLSFSLSQAIRRRLRPGDEVVITQLDHEANRGPWLNLREHGVVVREVLLRPDGRLDESDLREAVTERTKVLAMGMASNALGTVNNVALGRALTNGVGAWLVLDAVHYAPHFAIDVKALDTDVLLCSAYKFYGPHVGLLYCREGLLDSLETDRLRTVDQRAPYRIETGTLNHAAIAGVKAAIEFIASFGRGSTMRDRIVDAMRTIGAHERDVASKLMDGLKTIRGVTVYGPPFDDGLRAPTVSFTLDGKRPEEVCASLADRAICAWDGHFYAVRAIEVLGLEQRGGVTRVGVVMYNTEEEVARVVEAVKAMSTSTA